MKNKDMAYVAQFLFPDEQHWQGVSEILQEAESASRVCRLKYNEEDHNQDVCMHVHKHSSLICGIKEEDPFGYEIKEPAELKRACFYLLNCQVPEQSVEGDISALLLSRRKYEELREKAGSCTLLFLAESLSAETGDLIQSAQLARVLKECTADGELKLCSRDKNEWSIQHALYIENSSSGWLLRISSEAAEDWVIAVPVTKAEVCTALYEWLLQPAAVSNSE
ncbi:hypothetical protein C2I18_28855 [Paenibacillus sp. PK3_47]|uniref:hypothetical protein n=1 Tax=Paenibacillus sp. PK3_47 TaxID=2072642 RepID=UPI00201E09F0|nr:hypothetical protein [Paenibacillus sp. PK3_47]UQZ37196.1 hypothetical protein C2I18_28855 [Paenibacillus sp. PK3_47]